MAAIDEISGDEPLIAVAGEHTVALYRLDGAVYATGGLCTHEAECLEGGYVEDGTVECPYHSAVFRIATGEVVSGPAQQPLPVYPVKVEGGTVHVDLSRRPPDG